MSIKIDENVIGAKLNGKNAPSGIIYNGKIVREFGNTASDYEPEYSDSTLYVVGDKSIPSFFNTFVNSPNINVALSQTNIAQYSRYGNLICGDYEEEYNGYTFKYNNVFSIEVDADNDTITISLGENVPYFDDDQPLTATDIYFTLMLLCDNNYSGAYSFKRFENTITGLAEYLSGEADAVEGIEIVSDDLLSIKLKEMDYSLVHALNFFVLNRAELEDSGIYSDGAVDWDYIKYALNGKQTDISYTGLYSYTESSSTSDMDRFQVTDQNETWNRTPSFSSVGYTAKNNAYEVYQLLALAENSSAWYIADFVPQLDTMNNIELGDYVKVRYTPYLGYGTVIFNENKFNNYDHYNEAILLRRGLAMILNYCKYKVINEYFGNRGKAVEYPTCSYLNINPSNDYYYAKDYEDNQLYNRKTVNNISAGLIRRAAVQFFAAAGCSIDYADAGDDVEVSSFAFPDWFDVPELYCVLEKEGNSETLDNNNFFDCYFNYFMAFISSMRIFLNCTFKSKEEIYEAMHDPECNYDLLFVEIPQGADPSVGFWDRYINEDSVEFFDNYEDEETLTNLYNDTVSSDKYKDAEYRKEMFSQMYKSIIQNVLEVPLYERYQAQVYNLMNVTEDSIPTTTAFFTWDRAINKIEIK